MTSSLAFFLFLLTDALFFSAFGGFDLDMGGHAAGAQTPFGVWESESRAQLGAVIALDAVAAAALFDNGPTVGQSIDGGAVHIVLPFMEDPEVGSKKYRPSRGQTILIILMIKKKMSSHF